MAVVSGTAGSVVYGGTAGTIVAKIMEWTGDFNMASTEVIQFGDTWSDRITSIHRATGTFVGSFDDADTMQGNLYSAWINGSFVDLVLYKGTKYWHGTAYITSVADSINAEGKADVTFNWENKGAWEYV